MSLPLIMKEVTQNTDLLLFYGILKFIHLMRINAVHQQFHLERNLFYIYPITQKQELLTNLPLYHNHV